MSEQAAQKQRPFYIAFIVAMDLDRLIGANNGIPWQLPDDMRWFREQTMGKPVVMGRQTYESIPAKFRPLPGRHNIVMSRNPDFVEAGITVVQDVDTAVAAAGEATELMIGGGAEIYRLFLPMVNRIYLTQVNGRFTGDTYLPPINLTGWRTVFHQHHPADDQHAVSFNWLILEKG